MKYSKDFLHNPFGAGLTYPSLFVEKNNLGQSVNSHNLWLQVALSGGIGALILFVVVIWEIVKQLYCLLRIKIDVTTLGLLGVLVGTLIDASFIDMLDYRWFWVILALVVVEYQNRMNISTRPLPVLL